MNNTTSIQDLPTDPANGGGNMALTANEQINMGPPSAASASALSLDQTTINQIVSGLQQASSSGLTQLKSRDIPQTTHAITQDPQIQPTYIPEASNKDYIHEYEENEDIISNYNKRRETATNLDQVYDELQLPILVAAMFFLFQLPIFTKLLFNHLPILFHKDGNINLYGYAFKSALFGFYYYTLVKIIHKFNA